MLTRTAIFQIQRPSKHQDIIGCSTQIAEQIGEHYTLDTSGNRGADSRRDSKTFYQLGAHYTFDNFRAI